MMSALRPFRSVARQVASLTARPAVVGSQHGKIWNATSGNTLFQNKRSISTIDGSLLGETVPSYDYGPTRTQQRFVRVAVVEALPQSQVRAKQTFQGLLFQLQQELYEVCGIRVEYPTHRFLNYEAVLSNAESPSNKTVRVSHIVALPNTEKKIDYLPELIEDIEEDFMAEEEVPYSETPPTTSTSRFSVNFDYGKYLYGSSFGGVGVAPSLGSASQSFADFFVFVIPDDVSFGGNSGYLANSSSLAGVYVLSRNELEAEVERQLLKSQERDLSEIHDSDILNDFALTRNIELKLSLGADRASGGTGFEDNYIPFSTMGHQMEAREALKQRLVEKFQL